jgi:CubicO group peptidase (beta-lactamase class C family)
LPDPAKDKSKTGETMTAQTAAKHSPAPQTPSLPHAKPESLGLSPVRLQRMSDAFKREIEKGTVPGVTVMVARRGQIGWFEALGKQSPASSAPMAHNTIFRIFSMTKPIVSIGIMMLIEDGHFLLGDPVAKFIPEFADQKVGVENNGKLELVPLKRQMTVQDLLRHTSGIPMTTPVMGWCSRCISNRGCAAARSAMPNTPRSSPACR